MQGELCSGGSSSPQQPKSIYLQHVVVADKHFTLIFFPSFSPVSLEHCFNGSWEGGEGTAVALVSAQCTLETP